MCRARIRPPPPPQAGLRPEELPSVRLLIDDLGGRDLKVLPVTADMIQARAPSAGCLRGPT